VWHIHYKDEGDTKAGQGVNPWPERLIPLCQIATAKFMPWEKRRKKYRKLLEYNEFSPARVLVGKMLSAKFGLYILGNSQPLGT
jgi:hypothetical protein